MTQAACILLVSLAASLIASLKSKRCFVRNIYFRVDTRPHRLEACVTTRSLLQNHKLSEWERLTHCNAYTYNVYSTYIYIWIYRHIRTVYILQNIYVRECVCVVFAEVLFCALLRTRDLDSRHEL